MPEQVYMNRMQREVCRIDAHTSVVVAGRGTGKGMLHAFINLRNFQQMPRSTTAFVCPNSVRAKTNTLPSMFQHWETWGFRRGVHWDIGRRPPASLGWPSPLITPEHWENIISFYNGAIGQIISQDRVGAFVVSDRVAEAVKEAIASKDRPIKYYEPTPEAIYKVNHGEGGTCE